MREALEEAQAALSVCFQMHDVTLEPTGSGRKRVPGGGGVDRDSLLAYVRDNPGSRGEQIAAALGTHVNIMRPVMKALIAERKVKTSGERRGMTYSPV